MLDDVKDYPTPDEIQADLDRKLFSAWAKDAAAIVFGSAVFLIGSWFLFSL